jgi:ParB family transcriptional regulator, chromosome partitioning protein
MKIQWIKIEAIEPNQRYVCSVDSLEQLADTIRRKGQVEPMKICFTGDGFRILDGEKRWRACKKLGLSRVKVIILEMET